MCSFGHGRSRREQERTGGQEIGLVSCKLADDRSQTAAETVAADRAPASAGDGVGHPGRRSRPAPIGGHKGGTKLAVTDPDTTRVEGDKGSPVTDRPDQADSLARPFRRRLRRMARPARVDMRLRKPWFLARLRTLG